MSTTRALRCALALLLALPALAFVIAPAAGRQPAESPAGATAADDPLVFSDDFETFGDSSRWSRSLPFPVQSRIVANGNHAARLTNDGGAPVYGRKTFDQAHSRLFIRLQVQVIAMGTEPVTLLQVRKGPSALVASITVDADGHIGYVTGPTGIAGASSLTVEPGLWHDLQVLIDTTESDAALRLWLDGAELTSAAQPVWFGGMGMRMLQIGDNTAGRHFDLAFDDIRVDDSFIPADRGADPVPGILNVRTVPPTAGVEFEIEGKTFTSDDEGIARLEITRWSTDLRTRIVVHDRASENGEVAVFSGWRDWLSPQSRDVIATFQISEPVSITFVDMQGNPVDGGMIDKLVVKSSTGDIHEFTGTELEGRVLLKTRIITTPAGLHNQPITYYLDQVIIDGANVVNRSQQRTAFETTKTWQISLLFYAVKFRAADAFFGTSLGMEIRIASADGTEYTLPLDENGEAFVPRMARGEYEVSVLGAGYSPPRPIMVSRDQVVELEVISKVDILLVVGLAGLSGATLLVIGRPFLVTRPLGLARRAIRGLAGWRRWGWSA